MIHCLNKEDLDKFFKCVIGKVSDKEYEETLSIYEASKYYEEKIIIINYLMTQIIQREIKKGSLDKEFLKEVYDLPILGNIVLDEINAEFIEFMFNHTRFSMDMNLNILYLKEKHESYDYTSQIRY